MTKQEKKERRRIKHAFQKDIQKKHWRQFKFCATPNQIKQLSKVVVDQMLAGKPQP